MTDSLTTDLNTLANIPLQETSLDIWDTKYRLKTKSGAAVDADIDETYQRVAKALASVEKNKAKQEKYYKEFLWALRQGVIPAGRIISNAGALEHKPATSTINCTVSGSIEDSMDDILAKVHEAGLTLKAGCVAPSTLVITEQGYVTAEQAVNERHTHILSYDKVSHRFEMQPILKHMTTHVPRTENIAITSHLGTLTTSIKHPVLIYRHDKLQYVRADEIQMTDALVHHQLAATADKETSLKAWFAGAHLGDGSAYEKKTAYSPVREKWQQKAEQYGTRLVFKIRAAEREMVERYALFFQQLYHSRAQVVSAVTSNNTPVWDFSVASFEASAASEIIDNQTGKKTATLKIPQWIKQAPEKHFLPFLAGLIDTNGTVSTEHGSITLSSQNKDFSYEIQSLLALFGVHSSITHQKPRSPLYNGSLIKHTGGYMLKISDSDFLLKLADFMADSGKKRRIREHKATAGQYDYYVMTAALKQALEKCIADLSHIEKQQQGFYHGKHQQATVSRVYLDRWAQRFPALKEHINWVRQLRSVNAIKRDLDIGETFYDFTVATHNNYLAGNNGFMVIHNCGIGYEFSTLRPKDAYVSGAGAYTSGPLSFMDIYDKMCFTVSSAGGRRGAQMATFDVGHPDVVEFIRAKREDGRLRQFNLSLLITAEFIEAVKADKPWPLSFPIMQRELEQDNIDLKDKSSVIWRDLPHSTGYVENTEGLVACKIIKTLPARRLWDIIMSSTYDYAEPGFILIDKVNEMNNNWFCEDIRATNPSLAKGTLVHTKAGILPIEKLEGQHFQVRALDGSWGNAKCWKSSDSATTKLLKFGTEQSVTATLEHKWPVLDRLTGRVHRVLTSELKVGDKIPKNLVAPLEIQGDMSLTETEGFFLGLWLADGHLSKTQSGHNLGITFNRLDRDLAERSLSYLNSLKTNTSSICEKEDSLVIQVSCKEVIDKLIDRLGLHTGEKHFPTVVWTSNDHFVRGFIDGFVSGDGYVCGNGKQRIIIRQKSRDVIVNFAKLLSFMGMTGDLRYSERPSQFPNEKDYGRKYSVWDYRLGKITSIKFSRLFSLTCERKQDALLEIASSQINKGIERNLYQTIIAIEDKNQSEPVWDIAVEHPQHLFPIEWSYTGNCGEQPLPPYGSCLLGSINLTRFVQNPFTKNASFNWGDYKKTIRIFTRMLDNVVEINGLPLEQQRNEITSKRRHGMGYLGLGSTSTMLGMRYGDEASLEFTSEVTKVLAVEGWKEALVLAKEKGVAPALEAMYTVTGAMLHKRPEMARDGYKIGDSIAGKVLHAKYSRYMQKIAEVEPELVNQLAEQGARFTHHSSIAPTGTISLSLANNASNGIEPSFAHHYSRNVIREGKKTKEKVDVFSFELLAYRHLINHKAMPYSEQVDEQLPDYFITADAITPKQHVDVQAAAQVWIDSSISKTANVPTDYPYEDFKSIYEYAYEKGLKGCTTFRFNPEVFQGVLVKESDLENTTYQFTLEDGHVVEVKGNQKIEYDGEMHSAANLFDALKEGYYGKF